MKFVFFQSLRFFVPVADVANPTIDEPLPPDTSDSPSSDANTNSSKFIITKRAETLIHLLKTEMVSESKVYTSMKGVNRKEKQVVVKPGPAKENKRPTARSTPKPKPPTVHKPKPLMPLEVLQQGVERDTSKAIVVAVVAGGGDDDYDDVDGGYGDVDQDQLTTGAGPVVSRPLYWLDDLVICLRSPWTAAPLDTVASTKDTVTKILLGVGLEFCFRGFVFVHDKKLIAWSVLRNILKTMVLDAITGGLKHCELAGQKSTGSPSNPTKDITNKLMQALSACGGASPLRRPGTCAAADDATGPAGASTSSFHSEAHGVGHGRVDLRS